MDCASQIEGSIVKARCVRPRNSSEHVFRAPYPVEDVKVRCRGEGPFYHRDLLGLKPGTGGGCGRAGSGSRYAESETNLDLVVSLLRSSLPLSTTSAQALAMESFKFAQYHMLWHYITPWHLKHVLVPTQRRNIVRPIKLTRRSVFRH
jgi:hypothetical protein